jgi:hypothetical protein
MECPMCGYYIMTEIIKDNHYHKYLDPDDFLKPKLKKGKFIIYDCPADLHRIEIQILSCPECKEEYQEGLEICENCGIILPT